MRRFSNGFRPAAVLLLTVVALLGVGRAARAAEDAAAEDGDPLVGVVSRMDVESAEPDWVAAEIEAQPDIASARALTTVEPGARVTVYLGTWCSDSRREVARLWRAFDEVGAGMTTELPFSVEYVAVDRDKVEPADRLSGITLDYVPTFVVRRDGQEVGRVVEVAVHGIERDLLDLLTGRVTGTISAREDLASGDAAGDHQGGR